ncbi:hypothetical protein AGMMS49965_07630 [Bacteroidia bacterium]|nr:hypothetical protein AGMMS49965_07630 [Bacteroidia bacterium]
MANEYKNIGVVVAEDEAKARELALQKFPHLNDREFSLRQDEDTLDTWFSSWLWPISVFDGIKNPDNEEIKYYYPTNDLVTGPDIIFFWVARMIMAGYEYRGKECFNNVYFTGIVRDKLGRKMSKQLGNSPDPLELIHKYGADGVRMGLMLSAPAGNDILFDESLCEQGRNFCNKIWNAFRLVKSWEAVDIPQPEECEIITEWFEAKLSVAITNINDLFSKYRISEALMEVYKLFWDDFSSEYLETIKPEYQKPIDSKTYENTINFFDKLLRLLHPFMPFITEELWQQLIVRSEGESIMIQEIPVPKEYNTKELSMSSSSKNNAPAGYYNFDDINYTPTIIYEFEDTQDIVSNIRTIRQQKSISNNIPVTLEIIDNYDDENYYIHSSYDPRFDSVIKKRANVSDIKKVDKKSDNVVSFFVKITEYSVPIDAFINVEEELAKLEADLKYHQGFLQSVAAKLANENFVAKAPTQVLELERKKQADAESKIKSIEEAMAAYRS